MDLEKELVELLPRADSQQGEDELGLAGDSPWKRRETKRSLDLQGIQGSIALTVEDSEKAESQINEHTTPSDDNFKDDCDDCDD